MKKLPKDIRNIIEKKKEQLKYQDLINEFKDIIHKFKKKDIYYELISKFNNPLLSNDPFNKERTFYHRIINHGLSIRHLTHNMHILKDNNKECMLCNIGTYREGYKIFNGFIFCNSCFSGKCGCNYDKYQKNYCYSYKNCDVCMYIFDSKNYIN